MNYYIYLIPNFYSNLSKRNKIRTFEKKYKNSNFTLLNIFLLKLIIIFITKKIKFHSADLTIFSVDFNKYLIHPSKVE